MLAIVVGVLFYNVVVAYSQSAVATFDNANGVVKGTVRFTALADGLQVQVSLSGLSGSLTHPWHVHVNQLNISYGYPLVCDYAGAHFDPFNANIISPDYTQRCSADHSLCEAGDLAGKFGSIPANGTDGSGTFSGTFLDRTGTLLVSDCVGRSVVIHNIFTGSPTGHRECANVYAGAHSVVDQIKLVALLVLLVLSIA
ncbi:hypothetical protein EMCRGX_G028778 [Ephydatia muelleri]